MFRSKTQDIKGQRYPAPRLTKTGLRLLIMYVAGPILALLALLDVVLYLYFRFALGSCYGVLCLL